MAIAEKIIQRVRQLPERSQAEVLDVAEYLLAKAEREQECQDRRAWSGGSLALALRGMEDDGSKYTEDDLKDRFP